MPIFRRPSADSLTTSAPSVAFYRTPQAQAQRRAEREAKNLAWLALPEVTRKKFLEQARQRHRTWANNHPGRIG